MDDKKILDIKTKLWPWIILFSRIVLFFLIQGLFALVFYFLNQTEPWSMAANYWPYVVILTNIICIYLLIQLYKKEKKNYWNVFKIDRSFLKKDILTVLGFLVIIAPISFLPNIFLARYLLGDIESAMNLLLRPMPLWPAIFAAIIFPITQGMVEIAAYFSYVMPRLQKQGLPLWISLGLPSLILGLQHIAVPFLMNIDFILWRGLMYIPFAFFIGIVMKWRPRLLPYLAIIHILMNLSFGAMLLFGI